MQQNGWKGHWMNYKGFEQPKEKEAPPELTDRQIYDTPIGPVCMSVTEHEAYLEEVEIQKLKGHDRNRPV